MSLEANVATTTVRTVATKDVRTKWRKQNRNEMKQNVELITEVVTTI